MTDRRNRNTNGSFLPILYRPVELDYKKGLFDKFKPFNLKSHILCSHTQKMEVYMSIGHENVVPGMQDYLSIVFVWETDICTVLLLKDVFHLSCAVNA